MILLDILGWTLVGLTALWLIFMLGVLVASIAWSFAEDALSERARRKEMYR